ncbi:MAG TPA: glycosyltransferase family 4 protein [Xanthomonadaceae bacterium]|nr:glycosyltransferase family 4 protein [Xanthomonadaceae bacterium]
MRHLLLTTSTLPRWENDPEPRFVLDLARHLTDRWQPTLLAPGFPGAAAEERLDGVRVVRYAYAPTPAWETLCYPGAILSRLQANPWLGLLVPGLLLGLRRAVRRELRGRPYACVHAHWLLPQGAVHALGFRRRTTPPLVITTHGGDLSLDRLAAVRALYRIILRRAAAVTVVAPSLRQRLHALEPRLSEEKVPVIPMGVDPEHFHPQRRRDDWAATQGLRHPVVLFVGRLVAKKGVDILLTAFSRLALTPTGVTLAIVGEGPQAEILRLQAETLGLAARVRFLGALPHDALCTAYASCDIFCAPSVIAGDGDMDGAPTVLCEAAACGLPLVGSALAGIPLVVIPGHTGYLVPPGDPAALAAALATLAADAALRRRLGQQARAHVRQFAWPAAADRFNALYEQVIAVTRGAGYCA